MLRTVTSGLGQRPGRDRLPLGYRAENLQVISSECREHTGVGGLELEGQSRCAEMYPLKASQPRDSMRQA